MEADFGMKKQMSLFAILIFSLLFSSCVMHYKDGGTTTCNFLIFKVINWNTLSGKRYSEIVFFPKSLYRLDYFDGREEKDFEKLLASAKPKNQDFSEKPDSPEESFVELHSLDSYPSSGNKLYDAYVRRGTKTNYYLIRRMICGEPTNFFIPDIASPLTDGDIAFMLLTDINCNDGWEKNLFPASVLEKEGYTARCLFDYLHASQSNRIDVARKLLEHYIDDETGYLHDGIDHLANRRFEDLRWIFSFAKKLIGNDADKEKLSRAVETIMRLSKLERSAQDFSSRYDLYTDGDASLEVVDGKGGMFKGAGSHKVDFGFYLHTADSHMNFFIADDGETLVVDIGGGGDTESEYYAAQGGYEDADYEPNRFYEITPETSSVKITDFYWE